MNNYISKLAIYIAIFISVALSNDLHLIQGKVIDPNSFLENDLSPDPKPLGLPDVYVLMYNTDTEESYDGETDKDGKWNITAEKHMFGATKAAAFLVIKGYKPHGSISSFKQIKYTARSGTWKIDNN